MPREDWETDENGDPIDHAPRRRPRRTRTLVEPEELTVRTEPTEATLPQWRNSTAFDPVVEATLDAEAILSIRFESGQVARIQDMGQPGVGPTQTILRGAACPGSQLRRMIGGRIVRVVLQSVVAGTRRPRPPYTVRYIRRLFITYVQNDRELRCTVIFGVEYDQSARGMGSGVSIMPVVRWE